MFVSQQNRTHVCLLFSATPGGFDKSFRPRPDSDNRSQVHGKVHQCCDRKSAMIFGRRWKRLVWVAGFPFKLPRIYISGKSRQEHNHQLEPQAVPTFIYGHHPI